MSHSSFHTKSITIKKTGNTAYADVIGSIPPNYFVENISVSRNDYCSEIAIRLGHQEKPNQVSAQVMHTVKHQVGLGNFAPGKYCARVNGNNDVVAWFEV